MIFYPPRKGAGTFGTVFFGLFMFALYRYNHAHKLTHIIIAVLSLFISLYIITPVLRNQIVEITENGIIISSFGKKVVLTPVDLQSIEYHHTCIGSYLFNKGKEYYQITPISYRNGESMLQEFIRIFGR
jgi:hypothetical protein